jgi:hypothetical protein
MRNALMSGLVWSCALLVSSAVYAGPRDMPVSNDKIAVPVAALAATPTITKSEVIGMAKHLRATSVKGDPRYIAARPITAPRQ